MQPGVLVMHSLNKNFIFTIGHLIKSNYFALWKLFDSKLTFDSVTLLRTAFCSKTAPDSKLFIFKIH
jgi:urea transporter